MTQSLSAIVIEYICLAALSLNKICSLFKSMFFLDFLINNFNLKYIL
jgi:hypothetical protein